MWQRKQTIYLVLVVIMMIAVAFMSGGGEQVAAAIVGMQAVRAILSYENRKKQMRLCRFGEPMCLILIGMFALNHWYFAQDVTPIPFYPCLEVVSIVLFEMAYRGVKHDDDLVRSADRIR